VAAEWNPSNYSQDPHEEGYDTGPFDAGPLPENIQGGHRPRPILEIPSAAPDPHDYTG
jgi:hypothetical protein